MLKLKEKRGITLVALVITIIILLILAGVTIAQLNDNGLFEKVKLAKEKSNEAKELENSILSEYNLEIENSLIEENESIILDKTNIRIEKKNTEIISGILNLNNETNKNIIWSSSNPNIVTVDANGKVTAIGEGTATITATSEAKNEIFSTCTVTVYLNYLYKNGERKGKLDYRRI